MIGLAMVILTLAPALDATPSAAPTKLAQVHWEPLLGWLPEDTETVIVSQGPFEVPKKVNDQPKFDECVQLMPAGLTLSFGDGILRKQLQGLKILCAVEGSRRYTQPRELGMMPYEGCQILRFDNKSDDALRKAIQVCAEKAQKKVDLAGQQVAVFTEKMEEDTWSFFVCRPQAGILLCATNREYLEETLKRIGQKSEKRALPADLPEWKHVDVKAKFWAVRHYRKEFAAKDPTSPLRPNAAANVPDPAAVGFVFWYSPGPENTIRARYLSGAKNATELVTKGWNKPSEDLTPKIKQVQPGVVEIVGSIAEEKTGPMFIFVLWAYLGRAIYL